MRGELIFGGMFTNYLAALRIYISLVAMVLLLSAILTVKIVVHALD